jgi:hypothetical protein
MFRFRQPVRMGGSFVLEDLYKGFAATAATLAAILVAILVAMLAVGGAPLAAQNPAAQELVTDRPDRTESAETVPEGLWQLEVGATFEWGEEDVLTLPGTLLRWGISPRFELRLGWDGWMSMAGSEGDGAGDGEIGGKVVILRGDDSKPQLALLFASSLPWGSSAHTTGQYDPSFRFALDQDLGERVGFGANMGLEWESDSGDSTNSWWVYTAVLGGDLSPSTGAFVELYGREPASAVGSGEVSIDGGFTWRIRPELQLDIAAGLGLTSSAADGFVGVGLSLRR